MAYVISLNEFYLTLPYELFAWEFGPFHGLGMGLYGCWLAMIADLLVRGVFFLIRFLHGGWQKQRV